jgi:HK97 family phage prohead protease
MAERKTNSAPEELVTRSALVGSIDEEERTVDLIWTTGARVVRHSFDGPFVEELAITKSAIDVRRLNAGAPLLNAHRGGDDALKILGAVVPGSVRIEDGKGYAQVRFDTAENDPDAEKVFRKIQNKIISGVSVGYRVHEIRQTEEEENGVPVFRVTKWEPHEISVAPIQADLGSAFRSLKIMPEKEEVSKPSAPTETRETPEVPATKTLDAASIRKAERERASSILDAARTAKLEDAFARKLIEDDVDIDEARKLIIEEMADRDRKVEKPRGVSVEVGRDLGREGFRAGVANVLESRINPAEVQVDEVGRQYRGLSLMEMARMSLQAHGVSTAGRSKLEVAGLALRDHSTSDFPLLLSNVTGKTLRAAYTATPKTYEPLTRRVSVPDFKEVSRMQLGDAPTFERVPEGAEYKLGTVGEGREVYQILTYGKMIAFTRQMMINDDLDAFARIVSMFGVRASELESDLVWNQITSNPTMGDGTPLFDAAHGNLGAGAIGEAGLSAMRIAMRTQKGIDGARITVRPAFVITPVALMTTAQKELAAITPNATSDVNPFANAFQIISEERLDDVSAVEWYGSARPGNIDVIETAYLEGESGPRIESETKFETDGMQMKAALDFGTKVIDWRGLYKSTGV